MNPPNTWRETFRRALLASLLLAGLLLWSTGTRANDQPVGGPMLAAPLPTGGGSIEPLQVLVDQRGAAVPTLFAPPALSETVTISLPAPTDSNGPTVTTATSQPRGPPRVYLPVILRPRLISGFTSIAPANPTLPGNGQSSTTIRAVVVDESETPLAGRAVIVTTNAGTPPSQQVSSDASGIVTATLTSSLVASAEPVSATVTFSASSGEGTPGSTVVTFTAPQRVEVSTAAANIPADGETAAAVTAQVFDTADAPMPSYPVSFGATPAGASVDPVAATTGTDGRASTSLTSLAIGTVAVVATAGSVQGSANVPFVALSPDEAQTTLEVLNPDYANDMVPVNRDIQLEVVATVRDKLGRALSGQQVAFGLQGVGAVSPATVTTDSNGMASAQLANPNIQAGQATAQATVGVLTKQASPITFVIPACIDIEDDNDSIETLPRPPILETVNGICTGSLVDDPALEDDYFGIDLAANQTIEIDLTHIPADGDYHLALFQPLAVDTIGQAVRVSEQSGNADERITYTVAAGEGGVHYIRVFMAVKAPQAADNTFRLTVLVNDP